MIKITEIIPKCFLVTSPSQFEVNDTFIRPQEFYESDLEGIKGEYFSFDEYMRKYAEAYGNFTYYTDWAGFNLPGIAFRDWIKSVQEIGGSQDFRDNECNLILGLIEKGLGEHTTDYYLIGAKEGKEDTISHEVAHALYYLNGDYTFRMDEAIGAMPQVVYTNLSAALNKMGYCLEVIDDEIQAHLSTGSREWIKEKTGLWIDEDILKEFKHIYESHRSIY